MAELPSWLKDVNSTTNNNKQKSDANNKKNNQSGEEVAGVGLTRSNHRGIKTNNELSDTDLLICTQKDSKKSLPWMNLWDEPKTTTQPATTTTTTTKPATATTKPATEDNANTTPPTTSAAHIAAETADKENIGETQETVQETTQNVISGIEKNRSKRGGIERKPETIDSHHRNSRKIKSETKSNSRKQSEHGTSATVHFNLSTSDSPHRSVSLSNGPSQNASTKSSIRSRNSFAERRASDSQVKLLQHDRLSPSAAGHPHGLRNQVLTACSIKSQTSQNIVCGKSDHQFSKAALSGSFLKLNYFYRTHYNLIHSSEQLNGPTNNKHIDNNLHIIGELNPRPSPSVNRDITRPEKYELVEKNDINTYHKKLQSHLLDAQNEQMFALEGQVRIYSKQLKQLKMENSMLKDLSKKHSTDLEAFELEDCGIPQVILAHAREMKQLKLSIKSNKQKEKEDEEELRQKDMTLAKLRIKLRLLEKCHRTLSGQDKSEQIKKVLKMERELENKDELISALEEEFEFQVKEDRRVLKEMKEQQESDRLYIQQLDSHLRNVEQSVRHKEKGSTHLHSLRYTK